MDYSLDIYKQEQGGKLDLPYADGGVHAGFPSPAQDYIEKCIDLNKELVKHPATTFYAKVVGNSMIGDDINDGDILVIDRSIEPYNNSVVVCYVDGDFTLKRIRKDKNSVMLMPSNDKYKPIVVTEDNDFVVWGVVTYIIKKVK